MNLARPWLLAFCLYLASYNAAFAATLATVSADGGAFDAVGLPPVGGVQEVGKRLDCNPCSLAAPSASSAPVNAGVHGNASFLGALALADAQASAAPGHLGVSIQAGGSASKDTQRGTASVSAVAEWTSRVRFTAPGVPDGTRLTAHPVLYLEGEMTGTASGNQASSSALFEISDLSSFRGLPPSPYSGGYWGRIVVFSGSGLQDDIPGAIRFTRKFTTGEFGTIGFRFTLRGFADSDATTTDPASSKKGSAVVTADASRSLRWGGIEKVTDDEGNLITDWSITSDDGFDFSQPFGVPEPSSILLLGTMLGAGLATARRRE